MKNVMTEPSVVALNLPSKGPYTVLEQLQNSYGWMEELMVVEFKGNPGSTGAKSLFLPSGDTRAAMIELDTTRFDVTKLLTTILRIKTSIAQAYRFVFLDAFRSSRSDSARLS